MLVIKVIYRKNLQMNPGKLAAQVAHAVSGLGVYQRNSKIIVLEARDVKFFNLVDQNPGGYLQEDMGFTKLPSGTVTAYAWIDSYREE